MTLRGKTGLIVAGIAAILIAALIVAVPALVNLDRYRPRLISYLQEKTGRQVEIGRLALTFFPVRIHIDNFGVKNPPLFPPGYVVEVSRIDAELSFRALLKRKVMIKSIQTAPRGNLRISSSVIDIDGYGVDLDASGSACQAI